MRSSQTVEPFVCSTSAKHSRYLLRQETYKVVHERGALDQNSSVVRKGRFVDVGTVLSNVATIVDQPPLVIDVVDAPEPLPCLFSVLGVSFVSGISGKSSADVEEASIGNSYQMSVRPPSIHTQGNPLFL